MRKLKIYLDTSVVNFISADDAPEKQDATLDFLKNHINKYDVYYSDILDFEVNRTPDPLRKDFLLGTLKQFPFKYLDMRSRFEEIEELANGYLKAGLIPKSKRNDALHIAICTIFGFDVLMSWNYKHMANINKQIQINLFNADKGHPKTLYLLTPYEVYHER